MAWVQQLHHRPVVMPGEIPPKVQRKPRGVSDKLMAPHPLFLTLAPRTRLGLQNRTLPLRDQSGEPLLPLFLYEESLVDGSVTKGLFRGPLLLKVRGIDFLSWTPPDTHSQAYRAIFLGRSHASGSSEKTKGGNAKIHGMTSVIPSTICYVAIQVNRCVSPSLTCC